MEDEESKGSTSFTANEISEIRKLMSQVRASDRDGQKKLRHTLRKTYNFRISELPKHHTGGFTVEALDKLIASGEITITDK